MTDHTPTPWLANMGNMPEELGGGQYLRSYTDIDGRIIRLVGFALAGGSDTADAEDNAAFIIQAVNAHDALMSFVEGLANQRTVEQIDACGDRDDSDFEGAYDAIIKAARAVRSQSRKPIGAS